MKLTEIGLWAVLASVGSASRCARPTVTTSATSSVATGSSSIPDGEILPSSSAVLGSAPPSSSASSSFVTSTGSLIPSSSTPVSSSRSTVIETCGGHQCFAAITAEPTAVGESFCSSWLSKTPATEVITETAIVTSTYTNLATTTSILTLTTATTTKLVGSTTQFLKKRVTALSAVPVSLAPAPSVTILNQCASDDERVSSACGCFLSTTSTVTVYETSTSTVVAEVASTVIETSTTKVIATVEATTTRVIPAQPVIDPGFEGYLKTGTVQPWALNTPSGGQIQILNGINPCVSGSLCAGGQVVLRVYPPTSPANSYVSISQEFLARPMQTYQLSYFYRCLNYNAAARIEVWYAGQLQGSTICATPGSAFARPTVPFTTDATGLGTLEIRFVNPGGLPYLYIYADDFRAEAV